MKHHQRKQEGALKFFLIKTIADAILDRIVRDAHIMEMSGESMRKKRSVQLENKTKIYTY